MFVPAPAPNEYVAGFAFSTGHNYVALVRKQKPEWQAGLLNGVGGKVEPDETPADAIYREFTEECSLQVKRWRYFATVSGGHVDGPWRVHFYWTWIVDDRFTTGINYGREAEHVEVFPIKWLGRSGKFATIPNLAWLIPLAVEHMRGHSAVIVEEIDGRG
jgi:8-oxo-dGTP pyrophosphatase MutT (NUDIX family)